MSNDNIKRLENDEVGRQIMQFIVNNLGINLCSVDNIIIGRKDDDSLVSITIAFDNGISGDGTLVN